MEETEGETGKTDLRVTLHAARGIAACEWLAAIQVPKELSNLKCTDWNAACPFPSESQVARIIRVAT